MNKELLTLEEKKYEILDEIELFMASLSKKYNVVIDYDVNDIK